MERAFRISVRELVAFSCAPADILPMADTEALLTGTLAHKARQAGYEGQVEQTIKHVFELDGASVLVYGRMDAFVDGSVPFVEEIKHCAALPSEVRVEHRMQALCYAAMLAEERGCDAVRFCVSYVNLQGRVLISFEEQLDRGALYAQMETLLKPYVRYALREAAHRAERDESLKALRFPFDQYRKGQRELAVQVYTAITRKKRLFASLPTGTGKSAAVLFPSLKALGEGKTERIVYLTARNTARQSPLNAIARMQERGMRARCCVLTAREKLCSAPARCHPDDCQRARGHYLRQEDAIRELMQSGVLLWDEQVIRSVADRHMICPFEFALALCELSDVLMMDLNYAFDPFAQLKRLFQKQKNFTLLVDEAHHTVDRVRESLSGSLDSRECVRIRAEYGKRYGRKNDVYRSLGGLIQALRQIPAEADEATLHQPPEGIGELVREVLDAATQALAHASEGMQELIRLCLPFLRALEHLGDEYAILVEKHGKERVLTLYCLLPGTEIARVTKGLRGTVFFSATLSPLPCMKQLLGGGEEDACFALPSPFSSNHLAVVRKRVQTQYARRGETAGRIADIVLELMDAHPGNTIVFFPSYAYLGLVLDRLHDRPHPKLWIQRHEMTEEDRAVFLSAFEKTDEPLLGLCVLGGLFSEGVDLPGNRLLNAVIVGVGLPVPSVRVNAVKGCYHQHFGDGFSYACRIPAMHKVLQAAGRVIRSEEDLGVVVLADSRYFDPEYEALLPREWRLWNENIRRAAESLEEST